MPSPLDRRVWLEANTLRNHGYKTIILCPNSSLFPKLYECIEGIQIYRYPQLIEGRTVIGIAFEYLLSFIFISVFQLLIQVRHKIEIVQYCNPPDFLMFTDLLVRLSGRKVIFDQHDVVPELWLAKDKKKNSVLYKIISWLEVKSIMNADAVLFASEGFAEKSERIKDLKAKPFRIVKTAPVSNFGNQITKSDAKSDGKAFCIGYIGRMGKQDNVELLLRSFAILIQRIDHSQIKLKLVGDGPERQRLERLACDLLIQDSVQFLGYIVDENELSEKLKTCDIAVCPDIPNEMNHIASMNKIVEYMALELPIVQFDLRENTKTCGEFSFVVKTPDMNSLADAMYQLLNDEELRFRMRKGAKARFLNELCWEVQEKKLLDLYKIVGN